MPINDYIILFSKKYLLCKDLPASNRMATMHMIKKLKNQLQ